MEHKICLDSEVAVLAEGDGVVTKVDATNVSVRYDSGETKDYKLIKFLRSNHGTCVNQKPIGIVCPDLPVQLAAVRDDSFAL